jgi:DNA-binding winged helix-turn-helix (wHTH) protein
MAPGSFRFDRFLLDPGNRQLKRDGTPVDLNARYLDALTLLVGEDGRLVSKDRFLDEVWRGVPVTDEALTQCIKTLRRQLGDNAANPRFIETVPKHGYRFIAQVESVSDRAAPLRAGRDDSLQRNLLIGAGGVVGGGIAGLLGGLFYGFAGASQPLQPGMGAISVLLVLVSLTVVVALAGAAGVAMGIALANWRTREFGPWSIAGGGMGGLLVGAVVKLLGIDAFNLLLGQSPGDITGGAEGAMLGGAVGLGAWLGTRNGTSLRRAASFAALSAGGAGMAISLLGGRLMAGSLDLLARTVSGSRLRLDQLGALFGEQAFGPLSQAATGALEGGLFGGCVVAGMILARRSLTARPQGAELETSSLAAAPASH